MLKAYQGIAIEWSTCIFALIFVLLRIYVQWLRFTPSDYLIVVTWLVYLVNIAMDTFFVDQGLIQNGVTIKTMFDIVFREFRTTSPRIIQMLKTMYAIAPLQYLVLWGVKATLLLFYYQVVPHHLRFLRLVLHITTFITAASIAFCIILNLFWCYPVNRNWDITKLTTLCFSYHERVPYYTTLGFHLLTNILIFIIPFPLLREFRITRNQTYAVIALFYLGFLSFMFTVARALCNGLQATVSLVGIFSAFEQGSGIIVACSPALRHLFLNNNEIICKSHDRLVQKFTFKPSDDPMNPKRKGILSWLSNAKSLRTNARGKNTRLDRKASAAGKNEWEVDVEIRLDGRETSGRFPMPPRRFTTDNGESLMPPPPILPPKRPHSGTVEVIDGKGRIKSLQEYDSVHFSKRASNTPWSPSWSASTSDNIDGHVTTGIRGIERENNIARNLRHAYDVHLHIQH